jgi:tRNA pseudouridine32 synthase / 23S rRNA pseudouridine746 synthase
MGRCSPAPCGEGLGVGVGRLDASVDASLHLSTPLITLHHKGGGNLCWLALEPVTGRTHQLRVHCAEMGWPIVGDAIYGNAPRSGGPVLHLHAREVVVQLYKNRAAIRVLAPLPPHMRAALEQFGWQEEALSLRA